MKNKLPGYRKNIIKILAGFFLFFPWITYTKILEYDEAQQKVFSNTAGLGLDFFLYYKEMILIFMAVFFVLWFLGERVLVEKKDNNVPLIKGDNKWLFVFSGIFVGFAIFSTILSDYKKSALWGSPTEAEGLWVLIGYVVLILAFYNYFANEYGIGLMKISITAVGVITILLSLVEWFYKPLLEIDFVKSLVSPAEYAEVMASVEASVFESAISLTMYNPGYYGGFVCLLLPFALSFCLGAEKLLHQILYGVMSAGLMFCVVVANTTTSLYIAIIEVVLVIAFSIWKAKEKKKLVMKSGVLATGVLIALLLFSALSGNDLLGVLSNSNSATGKVVEDRFEITDITLENKALIIEGEDVDLCIAVSEGILIFSDENGNTLDLAYTNEGYVIQSDGYENIKIDIVYNSAENGEIASRILVDAGYEYAIGFYVLRDGTITGIGTNGDIVTDIEGNEISDAWKQYYGLFTGRGYAWINSLPILKDTILVGVGPGNFAHYFNHNDYMGLLQTHGNAYSIIDKPHNMYLQYAIHLGIPGMIAFFAIIVVALVKGVKIWKENRVQNASVDTMHLGAIIAVGGFLIYACINDSIITVTPVLCMVVGLLLAMTYMKKNK